ncbi:MAG: TRAP transporter large permease subunit, partial [Gemmatimonadetes bacterium]|nr:TRAP transporter large permease subunit [Gemmatimonadota bacterium]NIY35006.1 TRAP transporter large permease subunit [Gemmatimonadota bacterium]
LMPILVPVAESLGMDPIHFAILVAANVGIGMISPPVGICLYVACGISGATIEAVTPRLLPYLTMLMTMLMVLTLFPDIALFLPRLLGYSG